MANMKVWQRIEQFLEHPKVNLLLPGRYFLFVLSLLCVIMIYHRVIPIGSYCCCEESAKLAIARETTRNRR